MDREKERALGTKKQGHFRIIRTLEYTVEIRSIQLFQASFLFHSLFVGRESYWIFEGFYFYRTTFYINRRVTGAATTSLPFKNIAQFTCVHPESFPFTFM